MKTYKGQRKHDGCVVTVGVLPLESHTLREGHPIAPYDWGHCGPHAAHLAQSLLNDALESDLLAREFVNSFLANVVAALPREEWSMSQGDIWRWAIRQCESRYDAVRRKGPPVYIV